MIAPVEDIQEARRASVASLKEELVPVFEASGIEVTRDDSEMVLYCENLKQVEDKHKFTNNNLTDDNGAYIQQNSVSVIKLQGISEEFATNNLLEETVE